MLKRLIASLVLCAAAQAADLVLVQDREPRARIVLRANADKTETLAAKELQAYVKRMTGAELTVSTDAASPGAKVFIGIVDPARAESLRLREVKWDGYVIKRDRDVLWLVGQWPEGTQNAVYGFLEGVCGVRWFIPTQLGENVPPRETLAVGDLDVVSSPRFACRRNHGIDQSIRPEGDQWRQRVRITSHSLDVPFNRYSHNLYAIVRTTKYGKTHPEYFPLRRGKRHVPTQGIARVASWQPCMTHHEVDKLAVTFGRKWFASRPRTNFFSVGMNDGRGFCECPQCRAQDVLGAKFRNRSMLSDRYFDFVRRIAEPLARSHPDRYVSCIAYSVVESLPTRVTIPDNVLVVITQDVCQWHDPDYRKTDEEFAAAWAKAAGAFGTYDYTALSWLMPRVCPHLMAESIKFYDRIGAVAITNEAWPTWWYCGPQLYLRAKLMWDAAQDADAVLDEYYRGFYGPAHGPMKALFEAFERCTTKPRPGKWFEGLASVTAQMNVWEPKDVAECRRLLADAKRLADGRTPFNARVELTARGFAFADLMLEEYWHAQRLEAMAADTETPVENVLEATLRLIDLGKQREQRMAELAKDRYMWGIYRMTMDRFKRRMASWHRYLDSCQQAGASRLTAGLSNETPARIRDLMAKVPAGPMARDIRDQLWALEHPDAPNLVHNPGFEATGKQAAAPQGADWVGTDCPPAWSKWSIDPAQRKQLTWEPDAGMEGSACVQLAGCRMACFIQKVKVKPGERYHVSSHAWSDGSAAAVTRLKIRWQTQTGAWLESHPGTNTWVKGPTRVWVRLARVVTVPPGAGYVVLLPGAADQQPRDLARHDCLSMVRLPD